jgi:hypothetical protein
VFLTPALLGHRPWASLATALAIHRDDFTAPRDYALWLIFNPLDLALFVGLPVAFAWAHGLLVSVRGGITEPHDRMRVVTALGLLALVLAGITRGEVGRIWIPLMPALLVAALVRGTGRPRVLESALAGTCLLVLCLAMRAYWQVP